MKRQSEADSGVQRFMKFGCFCFIFDLSLFSLIPSYREDAFIFQHQWRIHGGGGGGGGATVPP